ncbi:hypothetical protein HZA98_05315 [Candidatus Woesearchaeota archaeon]|nr:hypothetical protein [Candidatus Woesearchaeota archaeon]
MFDIKECKTKGGYEVKPREKKKLDFSLLRKKFELVFDSPIALVLRVQGVEVIVHKYGELLVKQCKDVKKIESIARSVYA